MLGRPRRGDTLVEVMVAFAVFTVVAVGTNGIMNRGISTVEQSLEVTLVREQIDAQAALIRYARAADPTVWGTIRAKAKTVSSTPSTSMTSCPSTAPADSFMLNIDTSTTPNTLAYHDLTGSPALYESAPVNSRFDVSGASPKFQGIWAVPVVADAGGVGGVTASYDVHIGTCWYVPGSDRPMTLATIVRVYDRP